MWNDNITRDANSLSWDLKNFEDFQSGNVTLSTMKS